MAEMDRRIIQMQFDNKQFERNIAKSQKSVEDLKKAMNFDETSAGLKRFSQGLGALNFEGLASNIQKLTDKFTGLGDVGEYVMSRIRSSLEGAARSMEGFIKSISIDQISVGQGKYEAMNKAVQTIIADGKTTEKEAYNVMERVMEYTNQTSHSFSTMVGQASALKSVGMDLSEAERFLEGVANSATMAGAGANEAAAAMSLISKVMGGTHLGRQQFDSLNQTYRVITEKWRELALEAGVQSGDLEMKGGKYYTAKKYGKQVEVVASQLENTLNKKWFTSDVAKILYGNYQFGETLEELQHPEDAVDSFGKTAYLTGQRALTFVDALNAIKESVSAGWMKTFQFVLGDLSEAIDLFTDSCNRVIDLLYPIQEFRNGILENWKEAGGRKSLMNIIFGGEIEGTEQEAYGILDMLDGIGELFKTGILNLIKIFAPGDVIAAGDDWILTWLGIQLKEATDNVRQSLMDIRTFFSEPIIVNGETTTRLETIQQVVDGFLASMYLAYSIVSEVFGLIGTLAGQLTPSFDQILYFLGELGLVVYDTADKTYKSGGLSKWFEELGKKLEPVTGAINGLVEAFFNLLRAIFGLDKDADATEIFSKIGDAILSVVDVVSKATTPILNFLTSFINLLSDLISGKISLEDFGAKIGEAFTTMIDTFMSYLPEDFSIIPDWLHDLFVIGGEEGEKEGVTFFDKLGEFFQEHFGSFDQVLQNLTGKMNIFTWIKTKIGFGEAFTFLQTVSGWFKGTNLYGVIMAFLGVASLGTLISLILNARKAVKSIGGFFDDVGGSLSAGVMNEYEYFSERVLNFAKAIALIAAAIFMLSLVPISGLAAATVVVGLIFAGIYALTKAMSNIKGSYAQQAMAELMIVSIAGSVVAIVAALSVLMLAMAPLAAMGWPNILATMGVLIVVMAGIGVFIVKMMDQMKHFMHVNYGSNGWGAMAKMGTLMLLLAVTVDLLAVGLSTLMVAMAPLAAIGWQGALTSMLTVVAIMGAMGTFIITMMKQMNSFMTDSFGNDNGWNSIGKMAVMMLALAVTVDLLAVGISTIMVAMAPLAAMSWQSILAASGALAVVLTVVGTFIMVMLNQMDNFVSAIGGGGTSWTGIGKMAVMMLVLAGGVALLAVGIGALITAIIPLAAMSPEGVAKAVIGLGVILLELGLFMKACMKMADGAEATVKLLGFVGFAFSIGLLVMALTPLALVSWEGWAKMMVGLGVVLAELIGAMWLMGKAKVTTVSLAGFIGFAFSMALLMYALQPLAGMEWDGWGRAMLGLGIVLAELIAAMKIMDKLKVNTGSLFGFIGFAASLAILMFALTPLANMDQEGYYRAIFGLGTILLEIVALMAIINELKPDLKSVGTTALLLLALGASMVLFGIAMNEVKDIPADRMLAFTIGLSVLLGAVAGASVLLDKAGGIKGILLVAAAVAAILAVIALMADFVIGSISGAFRNAAGDLAIISNLLGSFSSNMNGVDEGGFDKANRIFDKVLGLVGKLFGMVFTGGDTAAFMTAMSQLTLAADEMQKFSARMTSLPDDGGATKASSIITLYKSLFENDLKGFSGYVSDAQFFYDAIFKLGSGFDYFDSMTSGLEAPEDNNGLKLIKELAGCAPDLETIYKMDLDRFKTQLAELGGAMIIYAKGAAAANTGEDAINEDTDIGAAMILLHKISDAFAEEGGFTIPENMPSDTELTDFGVQLAALAGALVAFEEAGAGLGDGTKQALETLDFFKDLKAKLLMMNMGSDLQSAINNFKDENGEFIQKDELTQFGEDIAQLGSSMAHFAQSTQIINEETGEIKPIDFSKATEALTAIGELQNSLPLMGGVLQRVIGTKKNLGTLAAEINLLGDAIGEFYTSTTTVDNGVPAPMDFTNSIAFLNSIKDLQGMMPRVKGFDLASLIESRNMTLGELGSQVAQLGAGINEFSKAVSGDGTDENPGFDDTKAMEAIGVVEAMIPIMNRLGTDLPKVGGLGKILSTIVEGRDVTLKDVGDQIGQMGEGLGKFGSAVSGKFGNADEVVSALGVVESMFGVINRLMLIDTDQWMDGKSMIGWTSELNEFLYGITEMTEGGNMPAVDNLVLMMDYISEAIAKAKNIDAGSLGIFSSFSEALWRLAQVDFGTITQNFETVGTNISAGVELGIEKGTSGVIVAAVNMAVAAYEAACKALDEHSPSRLFQQVGNYVGLGMAMGMESSTGDVVDAATGMSDKTIETAGTLMATISQIMAESTDANPTITPVLDLSQIQAGMATLNDDFGSGTYGLDTSVAARRASSIADRRTDASTENQNGTNLENLYERIATLGDQVIEMGESIRNMKIVLDSGVLAGGVTDGVDSNLGRRMFYAERNN